MKKMLVTALMFSGVCAGSASAASDDLAARLNALEKENAAIRAENDALRRNKTLRAQNAALKSSITVAPVANVAIAPAKRADPFGAYAADLPMAYKAPPLETPRQFRVWGEGGAIWSGGDRVTSDYFLGGPFAIPTAGATAGTIDLTPELGWEGATGFDYRFAVSPWHVSGQFRYGEGKASGSASGGGALNLAQLGLAGGPYASISQNDTLAQSRVESRWLADLAVGRDVAGSGADAMQVKFGVRLAEWTVRNRSNVNRVSAATLTNPFDVFGDGSVFVSQFSFALNTNLTERASFLGAGPRVGIEGAVPLAGSWAFDYLADVAVLFGNQKVVSTTTERTVITPAVLGGLLGGGNSISSTTSEVFSTALNADLQVGVSYWVTPNVKVSGSYRIDAIMMFNTAAGTTNSLPDRYTHGPRLGVSATF